MIESDDENLPKNVPKILQSKKLNDKTKSLSF